MLNKKRGNLLAFSLLELSVTILIIGILIAAISSGSTILYQSKLSSARSLTNASPVSSTSGLLVWLEATSSNSFSSQEAIDGSVISQWNDLNPFARIKNNATQSTTTQKPLYVLRAIKNLPSIRFDGAQTNPDCLVMSSLNINVQTLSAITLFMVYQNLSTPTQTERGFFGEDNGGNWHRLFMVNGTTLVPMSNGGVSDGDSNIQQIPEINPLNKPQIITYISQNVVSSGSYFAINRGFATYTFTENHSSAAAHSNGTAIGAIDSTCRNGANVDIGEFIIFERALESSEIREIEYYLYKKWGINLS